MDLFLLLLALLGHAFVWVALVNRIHGLAIPHRIGHLLSLTCLAMLILVPVAFWLLYFPAGLNVPGGFRWPHVPAAAALYVSTCWVAAGVTIVWWVWRHLLHRPPAILRFHRSRAVEILLDSTSPRSQEHAHHFLAHLPGNEILQLDVTERAIDVPRLPAGLDGLSIVHFSDFHFTGRVGKVYFQDVVRHSNELQPDLVAITGDLVDHNDWIDWLPDTLGRLESRHGVYFVLGNHDLRVDVRRLRRVLSDCGLFDLGGRWHQVDIDTESVILAGNELPWIAPAADLSGCPPPSTEGGPPRIVLSHSPDQLDWARTHDADLLLAGHTHGGQIRIPLIGPILSPSFEGVRYASGVFYSPPTIMHVTRGVSAELPIRLNCPPEMSHLTLRAKKGVGSLFR